MGRIFDGTGSGKNRSQNVRLRIRKDLMLAGLCAFCLLAGCAQKKPGQANDGAGEPSAGTWIGMTAAPVGGGDLSAGSGMPTTSPGGDILSAEPAEMPEEGSLSGVTKPEAAVLTDVLYDRKPSETSDPIKIQFLFSDGYSVERELGAGFGETDYMYVDYDDLTGDGAEEVVVHRYIDLEAGRYSVLNIFQVDGKEIRQLYPVESIDGIEGLEGNVRHEEIFLVDRYRRKGYGLHVEVYWEGNQPDKAGERVSQAAEEMDLFYEDGRWVRLPERELRAEVSLGSDNPEARMYEAFVRGECKAGLSGTYYSDTWYLDPLPAGQESFSFQEILDAIVSGIRKERTLDSMERVECALIDCGGDGTLELALRAYGVSIYSMRDDSEIIMIFRCRDGRLEWGYSVDCWARSDTDIYPDGYVSGGGSGGAMTHYVWNGMIGADGVYREYDIYIESGQSLYGMTVYKAIGEETLPAEFYECTLGEEKIYGYYILEDTPEDVRENVMAYIAENEEEMGVKFLASEEMDRQLDKWADSLGITEEMRGRVPGEAEGISWKTVGGCEDYLYGQP